MPGGVDFLGIGAQKSGTTWLYTVLSQHPHIWMPPIKELHYFTRSPQYPSPNRLAQKHFTRRVVQDKAYLKTMLRTLLRTIRKRDWAMVRFYLSYYTGTYDDSWYLSLFEFGGDKIKGEITPAYSMLNAEDVQHIRRLLPDLKIILLLRNPIERAWSHYSHYRLNMQRGGQKLEEETIEDIKQFMDESAQSLRGNYPRAIHNWTSSFPPEQVCIRFYDEMTQDPHALIDRICAFLGVDAESLPNKGVVSRHVNVSRKLTMSPEIRYYLAEKYYDDIQVLHKMLDGPTGAWLQETEQILQKN